MIATAVGAGLLYFIGVFALGFLLGGIRLMLLEPAVGELLAVVIELPVILTASWLLCGRAIIQLQVPASILPRGIMGASALLMLLLAEFVLAVVLFAEPPGEFFGNLLSASGLAGLGGQIVFALFPLLHLRFSAHQE